ncbi:MAG: GNAT family N-acetyltransferase [Enterobacterales bacterium]|nr:GNAT family N-acetyltransferase [Enterobacterales bacterium]
MSQILISLAKAENYQAIADFAAPIWYQHYTPIIGQQQVAYMLDKFQSVDAIKDQTKQGYQYYLVQIENQLIGYFCIQTRADDSLFISKFYLNSASRGKGVGRKMLEKIESIALEQNCQTIELSVNKENPAYKIYLKLGFICQKPVQFDIGNGYIMDDYWMVKTL